MSSDNLNRVMKDLQIQIEISALDLHLWKQSSLVSYSYDWDERIIQIDAGPLHYEAHSPYFHASQGCHVVSENRPRLDCHTKSIGEFTSVVKGHARQAMELMTEAEQTLLLVAIF